MRGKLDSLFCGVATFGITPADAGKTVPPCIAMLLQQDHPRGCGENAIPHTRILARIGSPPRMRGKHSTVGRRSIDVRITPADAGKTNPVFNVDFAYRDHPRGCGENHVVCNRVDVQLGSPPRMRGKPFLSPGKRRLNRITPADAGKTLVRATYATFDEDHPRGCGENTERNFDIWQPLGSPPRMRGKRFSRLRTTSRHGITPADAGKTLKRSFRNQPFCS